MESMNYLLAIERPQLQLKIDGTRYIVTKASLRKWFQLNDILVDQSKEHDVRTIEYVACALDVAPDVVAGWFALDVQDAFNSILELNTMMDIHIDHTRSQGSDAPRYEYRNRSLAFIVTRLASAFHWSRTAILEEITYDEARCYLQELAQMDHARNEFDFVLSQISHAGTKREYPELPFPNVLQADIPIIRPTRIQQPTGDMPIGVVIFSGDENAQQ